MTFPLLKSLRFKLVMIAVLPLVAFLLLNILSISPTVKNSILQDKKAEIQRLVHTVLSMMDYYYRLEQEGEISRETAQETVKKAIQAIRTGEGIQDYFWIIDFHPNMIVHPFRPELEGEDLSDFLDPKGERLFLEMVQLVELEESAFISYYWEYVINGEHMVESKLSFLASFTPWDWIVGTGINVSEIEGMVLPIRRRILLFTAVIFIVFTAAMVFLTSLIVRKEDLVWKEKGSYN